MAEVPNEMIRMKIGGGALRVLIYLWSSSEVIDGRRFSMRSRDDLEGDLDMPPGTLKSAIQSLTRDSIITFGRAEIGKARGDGFFLNVPGVE